MFFSVGLLGILWTIISICVPFILYGTYRRAKEIDIKLEETNILLRRIAGVDKSDKPESTSRAGSDSTDGYILASEYAANHNLTVEKVIEMISSKRLQGRPINGLWHVKI